jgi:hypothetical protein
MKSATSTSATTTVKNAPVTVSMRLTGVLTSHLGR